MAGSSFGTLFRITTWGESHGYAVGVTIDGCPAGIALSEEDLRPMLSRRRPGMSEFSSARIEPDECRILSGTFNGVTTGTPISIEVFNEDARPEDYKDLADVHRPSHADAVYDAKYGFRDWRGGGRASARETVARVIAGAVAEKILKELNIKVTAFTQSIGPVAAQSMDMEECGKNPLCMPDASAAARAAGYLRELKEANDSVGGIVMCLVEGCPAGIGEPVFDKLDAQLAKAVMSIGGVKGVEIGAGFMAAQMQGSTYNEIAVPAAGGILGGISDGNTISLSASVKPTPSAGLPGRHDPVIVPRAVVVVEAMVALTVLDMYLRSRVDRADKLF